MISSLIEDERFHLFVSFVCLPLIIRFAWLSTFVHHDDQRRTNSNLSNDLQIHRQDQTIDDETNFDQNDDQPIEIILKFLNETQRSIVVHSNDKIRKLKRFRFELDFFLNEFVRFSFRLYFSDELSQNKIIRLIYHGQELEDSQTLNSYRIVDKTIIHCHISSETTRRSLTSEPTQFNIDGLDISPIRLSIRSILFLFCLLLFFWFIRIEYYRIFSPFSTLALIFFTLIAMIFICAAIFPRDSFDF